MCLPHVSLAQGEATESEVLVLWLWPMQPWSPRSQKVKPLIPGPLAKGAYPSPLSVWKDGGLRELFPIQLSFVGSAVRPGQVCF